MSAVNLATSYDIDRYDMIDSVDNIFVNVKITFNFQQFS